MKQNITLRLDKELIRKARVLAAQQETSVSGLLARHLSQILNQEEQYETALRHALALLERGFHLGGGIPSSREEWHERQGVR